MKEHFQDYGVRKWAGDDLIELQSEPLAALQTLVAPYAPCIVSGCEVTPVEPRGYAIAPGLVALPGKDAKGKACVKLARFAGVKSGNDVEPYYLTLTYQTATRTYMDGKSKAIAYDYTATPTRNRPEKDGTFLEIGAEGGHRLVDTLGITQKLDREGGDAKDTVVGFVEAAARELPESGNRLGAIVGSVRKWFSDLRALAFKDKVALTDLDTDTIEALDRKVDQIKGKGLSEKDFTAALREKLEGIEDGANKYVHPTGSGNLHIPAGGSGGQYLRAGLNGNVLWGAGYTHPTGNGNNHIPAGGSSGQVLRYSAAGTAQWGTVGWKDVIGKPSTFTPSEHTHDPASLGVPRVPIAWISRASGGASTMIGPGLPVGGRISTGVWEWSSPYFDWDTQGYLLTQVWNRDSECRVTVSINNQKATIYIRNGSNQLTDADLWCAYVTWQ